MLPALDFQRVTYYNPVEAQTDQDPETSACGPNLERQVAVSRDLFRTTLHCGDVVWVYAKGTPLGRYVVWDTMHPRFSRTIDVMTDTSFSWGKTTGHIVMED